MGRFLSKEEQNEANEFGGAENPSKYRKKPGPHYSDKGGHKARGEANRDKRN